MLSNPSALFLCTSYRQVAIGAYGQGIRFYSYCPAWFLPCMKNESSSDQFGAEILQSVLFHKSLELSRDGGLNFECCSEDRRGWCWVERTTILFLILKKRERSTRVIKLLKRAWKCSSYECLEEKSYYGTKATVVDVKTARHLKDICFWYTSGNTTSARSMIASLLKQWRIKHKCLKCVLAPLQTGSFYVGVSQWGLNSSDLLNSCFIVLVCYIAGIKVMFTETILSLRNLITIR